LNKEILNLFFTHHINYISLYYRLINIKQPPLPAGGSCRKGCGVPPYFTHIMRLGKGVDTLKKIFPENFGSC
jgi:hypothetical protein